MNKGIILISPCCGRGFYQAKELIKRLNTEGLVYDLHKIAPRNAVGLIEKHGLTPEEITRTKRPYVIIEDICIPAESINDARFVDELIDNLKKIDWKDKITDKQNFLNKVENK